jgi:hypothetical protein
VAIGATHPGGEIPALDWRDVHGHRCPTGVTRRPRKTANFAVLHLAREVLCDDGEPRPITAIDRSASDPS